MTAKLETGTRIADHILVEKIGAGSYGEVWKALQIRESRIVAIKFATGDDAAAALLRDGVPQRDLVHPSIVRVHAIDALASPPYVVLEHVEGRTLRQMLRERGRFEPQDVGAIFRQLVDALAYAHERGVVHGDVKPENVLVIEQGIHKVVKLTDFQIGAPRAERRESVDGAADGVRPSLKSAVVSGTYHYLAPEQESGEGVDGRADLYALGVVLFEMATGSLPQGRDLPSDLNPALSWWWDHMFSRCYTGKERRYRDAAELKADLRAVYAGAPEWGALPSQNIARGGETPPRTPGAAGAARSNAPRAAPIKVTVRPRPADGSPAFESTLAAKSGARARAFSARRTEEIARYASPRSGSGALSMWGFAVLVGVPVLMVGTLFAGLVTVAKVRHSNARQVNIMREHARMREQAALREQAEASAQRARSGNVCVPSREGAFSGEGREGVSSSRAGAPRALFAPPRVQGDVDHTLVEDGCGVKQAIYGTVPEYGEHDDDRAMAGPSLEVRPARSDARAAEAPRTRSDRSRPRTSVEEALLRNRARAAHEENARVARARAEEERMARAEEAEEEAILAAEIEHATRLAEAEEEILVREAERAARERQLEEIGRLLAPGRR